MKLIRILLPVLLATVILSGAAYAVNQVSYPERPAPAYSPPGVRVVSVNTGVITQDTNFANINAQGYPYLDLFYDIDQTVGNDIDLNLEVSADAIDWYASTLSPTIIAAATADASGYVGSVPIEGYQIRIVADVAGSDPVTPVLKVVLR